MANKYTLLKKISVKTVCGRPVVPTDQKVAWLMEVFGVASGLKRGTSDKGDWYGFTGAFQALNMATGDVYRAGLLYLPGIAGDLVLPQVIADENNSVEFGFRIGVVKDEASAVGYVYRAEPLLPVSENDPIELLSHKMSAPRLESPKPVGAADSAGTVTGDAKGKKK